MRLRSLARRLMGQRGTAEPTAAVTTAPGEDAVTALRQAVAQGDDHRIGPLVDRVIDEGAATVKTVRSLAALLRNTNRVPDAVALLRASLDRLPSVRLAAMRYRLEVRLGDSDAIAEAEAALRSLAEPGDPFPNITVADALLRAGDPLAAEQLLTPMLPDGDDRVRGRLLDALAAVGDHHAVLELVANVADPGDEDLLRRCDALLALGRLDEAAATLDRVQTIDERVVERVATLEGDDAAQAALATLAADDADEASSAIESRAISLFRANRPAQAIEVFEGMGGELSPFGRQTLANALYSERRFDEALGVVRGLLGTEQQWSAMKLESRILIQLGRPDDALRNRDAYARPGDLTDQVRYHALLGLGRHAEAFREHPFLDDLARLGTAFPQTSERHPDGRVARRFVVADAGPGDEIQDASVLRELAERSDELTSTCDPRLTSLLRRSFPEVTFVPTDRWRDPPHLGSHGTDAAPRARNALHYLLTEEADAIARTHDRVVLGRAIKNARDLSEGPRPAAPFLTPDADLVREWGERLAGPDPIVGIVWRSERQTSWRAVHYLRAEELRPFADVPARFLCLQHDVTKDELATLRSVFGERVIHLADTDLRDDFETMAAVVASLDLTIGIGTTIVNLAAAVGCPTLMMQPSHFGSWLSTDDDGQDFWYGPCRVVVADPPYDTDALVTLTARRAAATLTFLSRPDSS